MSKVLKFTNIFFIYPGIRYVSILRALVDKSGLQPRKQQLLPPQLTSGQSSTPHCFSGRRIRPCSSGQASSPPSPSGCRPRSVRRLLRARLLQFWSGSNHQLELWLAAKMLQQEGRLLEQGWISSSCLLSLLRRDAD